MFITVLGKGTWSYGGVVYTPGTHEVSDSVAAAAGNLPRKIVVTETPPKLARAEDEDALSSHTLKTGTRGAVALHEDPVVVEVEDTLVEIPHKYECRFCDDTFPSLPAKKRHESMNHPAQTRRMDSGA